MSMYNVIFNDTGEKSKEIIRRTSGTGGILQFAVVDENGDAVVLTGLTTVAKVRIGIEGTLKVNADLTTKTALTGLATYNIAYADFAADTDCGTFEVELYFADNASPTKSITATGAVLKVLKSIID